MFGKEKREQNRRKESNAESQSKDKKAGQDIGADKSTEDGSSLFYQMIKEGNDKYMAASEMKVVSNNSSEDAWFAKLEEIEKTEQHYLSTQKLGTRWKASAEERPFINVQAEYVSRSTDAQGELHGTATEEEQVEFVGFGEVSSPSDDGSNIYQKLVVEDKLHLVPKVHGDQPESGGSDAPALQHSKSTPTTSTTSRAISDRGMRQHIRQLKKVKDKLQSSGGVPTAEPLLESRKRSMSDDGLLPLGLLLEGASGETVLMGWDSKETSTKDKYKAKKKSLKRLSSLESLDIETGSGVGGKQAQKRDKGKLALDDSAAIVTSTKERQKEDGGGGDNSKKKKATKQNTKSKHKAKDRKGKDIEVDNKDKEKGGEEEPSVLKNSTGGALEEIKKVMLAEKNENKAKEEERRAAERVQEALIPPLQKLVGISLKNCPKLTDKTLMYLVEYCPNLATLNVTHCPLLTDKKLIWLASEYIDLEIFCNERSHLACDKVRAETNRFSMFI